MMVRIESSESRAHRVFPPSPRPVPHDTNDVPVLRVPLNLRANLAKRNPENRHAYWNISGPGVSSLFGSNFFLASENRRQTSGPKCSTHSPCDISIPHSL